MSPNPNHHSKVVLSLSILFLGSVLWAWLGRKPAAMTPTAITPPAETARQELVQRDDHWYRKGETIPFTGRMIDFYPGGEVLARCDIGNGLPNGVSETWYTNGQMQVREHFKNGISNGLREKWYANGNKLSRAMISEGKVTGTFRSWHDNGQLAEQIEMKLGQPDGIAWAYYPSGFVKAETTVRDSQILDRKSWKDGELAASAPP